MKLATLRTPTGTVAARAEGETFITIEGVTDVGALLQLPQWKDVAAAADGQVLQADSVSFEAVIPRPSKILCCGLNYASHITEMGRELPEFPTLFAKFQETLTGPFDDIPLPPEDDAIDWEAELAIVIGTGGRRIPASEAAQHIAGYTVCNDISMRTWQFRTIEWLQGKIWERTTPLGPVMITPEELVPNATIRTTVDGTVMQEGRIDDLVHGPEFLVEYISTMITLNPGDVIITGTTGGVGRARKPAVYIQNGQTVVTEIEGIGTLRNRAVTETTQAQG